MKIKDWRKQRKTKMDKIREKLTWKGLQGINRKNKEPNKLCCGKNEVLLKKKKKRKPER